MMSMDELVGSNDTQRRSIDVLIHGAAWHDEVRALGLRNGCMCDERCVPEAHAHSISIVGVHSSLALASHSVRAAAYAFS